MLLNDQWVSKEIKRKIRKYLETNENGNTTYQNLWIVERTVLRGKFIMVNTLRNKKDLK